MSDPQYPFGARFGVEIPRERYYKMPPIGMTEVRVRIGDRVLTQQTVRCGSRLCWFVGHAATTTDAQVLLDNHTCPTEPNRVEQPTGYSTLEKLWDELDDVTAAVIEQRGYTPPGASDTIYSPALSSYARGIAVALTMMSHPYFKTTNDIVKEAAKRYKMRKGVISYEPTPGYRYNPLPLGAQPTPVVERAPYHGVTRPAQKRAPSAKRAANRGKVDISSLDSAKTNAIKNAVALGMMSVEEIAEFFEVEVAAVHAVSGTSGGA